jgi:signal transduction histidine kinase
MFNHQDVDAYPVVSFTGEKSVFFSRQLFNGWFVYLSAPYDDFYEDANALFAVLSVTGLISSLLLCAILTVLHAKKVHSDEASRLKSSFLANMSHEIRTPMNAIIGMSDILMRSSLSKRDTECVNDINESAHSLLSIINDILDLSKIESGKMSLNPVHYDFPSMMDNVVSMFTYVAKKKGLEFRFETEHELPKYLYGDDVRLRQMLVNICGNAVKFTENGFVRLRYACNDSIMAFEIQDTGVGITKEDIPNLFKDFEQSATSKNRYITGSGLGLAISKRFAEMMGGNIVLESEYGKGSCFKITIPLIIGDSSKAVANDEWYEEKSIQINNASILVVDDNEFNLKVAHGLLSLYGIDADTAGSGKKAIAKV